MKINADPPRGSEEISQVFSEAYIQFQMGMTPQQLERFIYRGWVEGCLSGHRIAAKEILIRYGPAMIEVMCDEKER